MIIETAREELKKQRQAQEGPVKFNIKYSDTDQTIRPRSIKAAERMGLR